MLNHMINKVREVRDAFHVAYCFIVMYPVNTQCVNVCLMNVFSAQTLLSLPDVVKNSEQLQQLVEYIG